MRRLYDVVDWKIESIVPEMAENKKFDEFLKELAKEAEVADPQFKTLKEPAYNLNLGGIIVVLGFPPVDKEKEPRLRGLIDQKLLPTAGVTAEDVEELEFEWSTETGKTTGTAIIKFREEEKAMKVAEALNGVKVPPSFVLTALTLNEFEEAVAYYKTPEDLRVINHADLLAHHETNREFERVNFASTDPAKNILKLWHYSYYDKKLILDSSIQCSFIPRDIFYSDSGNLLAAVVGNQVEIYGGRENSRLRCFQHKYVSRIKFSRKDKYVMTFNGPADVKFGSENLIVWNFLTGDKVRSFQVNSMFHFESFQFSFSEKFLCAVVKDARTLTNQVGVYELPTCHLLTDGDSKDRTYLPVEGVLAIHWAPRRDALFVASSGTHKADLTIWEIPDRRRIPWMAITYKVDSIQAQWGEHEKSIVVKMTSYSKKKIEHTIQLATIDWRNRQCYVSMLPLSDANEKTEFVVSPNGLYFAVLSPQKIGTNFNFFAVEEKDKSMKAEPIYHLAAQNMKWVSFSPFSNFLVLYNETRTWFAEIRQRGHKHEFKLIREVEQRAQPNGAVWTPCGRFVSFSVKSDELFNVVLYDFIGRKMCFQDLRDIRSFKVQSLNMAKETVWPQKKKDELMARVTEKNTDATKEDKRIRRDRKAIANMKKVEGFDRLKKYLEGKQRVWEELEDLRKEKLAAFVDVSAAEKAVVVRVDKTEVLEEIEDT
jgi:uncharacterized protein with WD repeat